MDLYQHSIRVILQSQSSSGAYVASPAFSSYAYCWLRDGSFIAYAMDQVGKYESAGAFFRWAARVIERYASKVERAIARVEKGKPLGKDDYLHTRYTLDGQETADHWWDFQLDGYGTWLWAVAEHIALTKDTALAKEVAASVATTVRYLSRLWMLPCYDCWEEHASYLHPHTLAAIYGGLRGAAAVFGQDTAATTSAIRRFVLTHGCRNGRLVKSFTTGTMPHAALREQQRVYHDDGETAGITNIPEASLIGAATPYGLLSPGDPIMQATIAGIEKALHRPGGGVYRYRGDTYYGGGEWIVLAAWLGWHYAGSGQAAQARQLLAWIEAQADAAGHLPEQVSDHLLAPERYAEWEARWGVVATPLTWSHAMYLILVESLK